MVSNTKLSHVKEDTNNEEITGSQITKRIKHPNPYQTQFQFFTNLCQDLEFEGNGYAWIDGDNLWHIPASDIGMYMTLDHNTPFYYQVTFFGKTYKFQPDDIIHVKNPLTSLASGGYEGISPILAHMLTFDTAFAHDNYNKNFFDNASQISGVVETPNKLQPQVVEDLRKQFAKKFSGVANAGKVPVLTDGLSYKQFKPLSPHDSDYIKSKELTQQDICQIFGVPESLLGIGDQKYSNAAQQQLVFSNYTIQPILTAISEELTLKLVPSYRKELIIFEPDILKYSTSSEVAQTLSLLVNSSIMTSNEARKHYALKDMTGDASKLLIDIETAKAKEAVKQAPKTTEDTNTSKDKQLPKTKTTVTNKSAYNNSRSVDEWEKSFNKVSTENGRLRKEIEGLRGE